MYSAVYLVEHRGINSPDAFFQCGWAFFTLNLLLQFARLIFLCTFCADRKYQRPLRMDAFLTKNVVDILWASGTRLAAQNGFAIFFT